MDGDIVRSLWKRGAGFVPGLGVASQVELLDCFWFDCHKDVLEDVMKDAEEIMTSIPEHYKKVYGMDVPVVFRVDTETGPNMKDLH